ncbi:MAG TPA: C40 family peptidase [Gemmatimonadaceae bacterium]|jgi:cell wall-associated NlpC family hydrolase|nr:C40 family peptidase [Gemmatimonadaceae bacterium]
MSTRAFSRFSAIAVVCFLCITGCTPATLGVSPGTILSTVIANIPVTTTTTTTSRRGGGSGSSSGGGTVRHRIPTSPAPSAEASRLLHTGDSYRGIKYVWGGNSPSEGFDCSGFTKFIFAKYGVTLPRTSREQAHSGVGVPADFSYLRPGDIMLFAQPGEAISHVAIYAGNGVILHASSSVGGVGYTDLNTGGEWFVAYFVAARRLL